MSSDVIEIKLSEEGTYPGLHIALISKEDKEFLNFNWTARPGRYTFYAYRRKMIDGKNTVVNLHREILAKMLERNLLPTEFVDHIDGNGLNNQRNNLRLATIAQNSANSTLRKDNTSGVKGVSWKSKDKRWVAQISVNGKYMYLGQYKDKEKAIEVVQNARKKYHKEFANNG